MGTDTHHSPPSTSFGSSHYISLPMNINVSFIVLDFTSILARDEVGMG